LQDRKGGRRRHRGGEAEGREPRANSRPRADGVVEGYQTAQEQEEAEILAELNSGPNVALGVLLEDRREVHGIFFGRMEDL